MTTDLASMEEVCSLLVPAYGLARGGHAKTGGSPDGSDDGKYDLLSRDDWYLRPRRRADNILSEASALFDDEIRQYGKRRTVRLREAAEPMPEGSRNTCLMIEGTRSCFRNGEARGGPIPGYSVWEESSADCVHRWVSRRISSDAETGLIRTKTVLFGRSGRGVLYAPIGGGKTRLLLIDFHIVDSRADSPDIMLTWASCIEAKDGAMPYNDPHNIRLSGRWSALIRRAIAGYHAEHGP